MHLSLVYTTHFDYPEPVRQSHNEVRAAPTSDDRQQLLLYRITSNPPARVLTYIDHWGTLVDALGIRLHHDQLTIEVEATVQTAERADPSDAGVASEWLAVDVANLFWEYLQPSSHVTLDGSVASLADDGSDIAGAAGSRTTIEVIDHMVEMVRSRLTYVSGSTEISSTIDAVLEQGTGVCQDYAHVLVALARRCRIPARYVSGYLYARDESDVSSPQLDDAVSVQTHAWVELALPNGLWVSRDPTNGQPIGERHVKIGHGRDYDDVAPFRGVYVGGAEPVLRAGVEMKQVRPPDPGPGATLALPAQRMQREQQSQQ